MIYHLLKIATQGLTSVAGINGAPVMIDPAGEGLSGAMPVNVWLKPKENTLSISLARVPPKPEVKLPTPGFSADLYSVKPNSARNEPDAMLARFERAAADPTLLPVNREIPFAVTAPPPAMLWSEADRVASLSAADIQQLRGLLQKYADAVQHRDLDGISAVLDYKTKDCALANGQDPNEMRQVIRQQFKEEMFTELSFRVQSPPPAKLSFKLIAGGQVVWLFQSLETPALMVRSQYSIYTLPVFAARIKGVWQIVR